jgi:hypothetical protein
MAIFCRHPKSVIVAKSNVIQFDQSGFPMRLETMECLICGKKYYAWNYIKKSELDELSTGKSVLCKWGNVE